MLALGPLTGVFVWGDFRFQKLGQKRAHGLGQVVGWLEKARGQATCEQPPGELRHARAGNGFFNDVPSDIKQVAVIHAAWAGAFTISTGQTAIEMHLGFGRRHGPFQHLFDQVDAPPGSIKLIAQQLIGWASGRAKSTMDTFSKNRLAQ